MISDHTWDKKSDSFITVKNNRQVNENIKIWGYFRR